VSSGGGDGLDGSLPALLHFDHVIVRALMGGKTYWLDGTRLGDRDVGSITVPPFKWALTIGPNTDALVRLVRTEPGMPQIEWRLDLDARAGIDKPAIAAGTAIFRGDEAEEWRVALAVMTVANRDQMLRSTWSARHNFVKVERVSSRYDDKTGDLQLGMTGTAEMDWNNKGDQVYNNYEADRATLGENLNSKRPEALQAVAPVYVAPRSVAMHQTILLPDGARGFRLSGVLIDAVIGGVHYSRTQSLVGERFTMSTTTQSGEGELSYGEAVAADKLTDNLAKKRLFIELPRQMVSRPGEIRQIEAPAAAVRLTGGARHAEIISGAISDEDYPADAIRNNQQGVAGVNFEIGVDGHVTACRVAISSGFASLDEISCSLIRERFVFKPALGPNGRTRPETRFQRVRWTLPEGTRPINGYDLTWSYTLGADGVARDCTITGTPKPPPVTAEQCAKASQGATTFGADGKPVEARISERHTRTVEPVASPVPAKVPPSPPIPAASSGNPR
jgi:TonB family protein